MKNSMKVLSFFILIISALFFYLKPLSLQEIEIPIEPVIINSNIENVISCFKNQYYNITLWKMFDYDESIVDLKIDHNNSSEKKIKFVITLQYTLFNLNSILKHFNLDFKYKVSTTLDGETIFEKSENKIEEKEAIYSYTISIEAISQDGLAESRPIYTLQKLDEKSIKISEKLKISVPKIFSIYGYKTAQAKHQAILENMKKEIEADPNICILK